jgi:hypothetical protein
MFTPKWISLKEAVDYIHRVEGGLRWVALEHLLQALRDQDVSARYASSLGPVTPTYWIDAARNPVHLRQCDYTEIGVRFEHVQRIWPMALALDPNQIIPTQRGRSATTVPTGEGDKEITPAMCHQANIDPSASVMVPPNGRPPIPERILREWMEDIKANGGPIPAADTLYRDAGGKFPQYHVSRDEHVRPMHAKVFGQQRPGRRRKDAVK